MQKISSYITFHLKKTCLFFKDLSTHTLWSPCTEWC